jgi:hypothetical protein
MYTTLIPEYDILLGCARSQNITMYCTHSHFWISHREVNSVSDVYRDCVDVGIVRRLINCICSPHVCVCWLTSYTRCLPVGPNVFLTSTASGVLHWLWTVGAVIAVRWWMSVVEFVALSHSLDIVTSLTVSPSPLLCSSARGTSKLNCDWFNYSVCPPPSVLVMPFSSSLLPLLEQLVEWHLYRSCHLLQVRETACFCVKSAW